MIVLLAAALITALVVPPGAATTPEPVLDWAVAIDAGEHAISSGVAVDADGNSTVAGSFRGTVTLGEGDDAVTLASDGLLDVFVASYNRAGTLRWAGQITGDGIVRADSVAGDTDGNTIVAGSFEATTTFGEGDQAVTLTTEDPHGEMFVASYTPDGALRWVTSPSPGVRGSATVDGSGNTILGGTFQGTAKFGHGDEAVTLTAASDEREMFLASYDPDGMVRWAVRAGEGSGFLDGPTVSTDADGNILATGSFSNEYTFGDGDQAVTLSTATGWFDMFLASFDPEGSLRWVTRAGGETDAESEIGAVGLDVAADHNGNAIVSGGFMGTATFGEGDQAVTLTTTQDLFHQSNAFVASYDADGTLRWVGDAGGDEVYAWARQVEVDASGNAIASGEFSGTTTFGTGDGAVSLAAETAGGFLASYDTDGGLRWAARAFDSRGFVFGLAMDGDSAILTGSLWETTTTFGTGDDAVTLTADDGTQDMSYVARYLTTAPDDVPIIEVFPETILFGEVELGSSATNIVTISNAGSADLTVTEATLESDTAFAITETPVLPQTLSPGSDLEVEVTFTPDIEGAFSDTLQITSDDPVHQVVEVPLSGSGVAVTLPPEEEVGAILAFVDDAVDDGTLEGSGAGASGDGRLDALRNMLAATSELIRHADDEGVCGQLLQVHRRTDGQPRPPDFVEGSAAEDLAAQIRDLMDDLACQS